MGELGGPKFRANKERALIIKRVQRKGGGKEKKVRSIASLEFTRGSARNQICQTCIHKYLRRRGRIREKDLKFAEQSARASAGATTSRIVIVDRV